jgi:hypothetical protein
MGGLEYGHSVFEVFRAPRSGDFSTARFYGYRSVTPVSASQVLARFDAGPPALLERRVGGGRVLLWTSTLDLLWSDLPLKPVFLPFVHRASVYLANYTEPPLWRTVGQVFDPQASARNTAVGRLALTPSGKQLPLDDEGSSSTAQVLQLEEQGFYEVRDARPNGEVMVVASNVDPAESDLSTVDPKEVVAAATGTPAAGELARADVPLTPDAQERSQRLWWYLLCAGVLLLGADTLLSNWLSRA